VGRRRVQKEMLKEKMRRRAVLAPYLRPDEEITWDVGAVYSESAPSEGYFVVTNRRVIFVDPLDGRPAMFSYDEISNIEFSPQGQGMAELRLWQGDSDFLFLTGESSCREIVNEWLASRRTS